MKKLLFITGTRADFGKLEPLALSAKSVGFRIYFFVTGMHLLEKYGLTSIEVSRMKNITRFEFINQMEGDPPDKILSKTITGISEYVGKLKPDLVLIHGDRIEAIAASLVCATKNMRSAHIEGGEVSGAPDTSPPSMWALRMFLVAQTREAAIASILSPWISTRSGFSLPTYSEMPVMVLERILSGGSPSI